MICSSLYRRNDHISMLRGQFFRSYLALGAARANDDNLRA